MRYSSGMATLTIVVLLLLFTLAVLGWMRPVVITRPDEYRARFDSLMRVVETSDAAARGYAATADSLRGVADSLAGIDPGVVYRDRFVGFERMGVNDAALDSIRRTILSPM